MTLSEIKMLLLLWFSDHPQITAAYWGTNSDLAGRKDKEYALVNIEYLNTNVLPKQLSHSYLITIADRIDPNFKDIQDVVISDSMMVAEDFFAFLDTLPNVTATGNTSIQPFVDDLPDRLAGITFRVVLTVPRKVTSCDKPNMN